MMTYENDDDSAAAYYRRFLKGSANYETLDVRLMTENILLKFYKYTAYDV